MKQSTEHSMETLEWNVRVEQHVMGAFGWNIRWSIDGAFDGTFDGTFDGAFDGTFN